MTANENENGAAGYHRFHNEDGEAYGSFEVFWSEEMGNSTDDDGALNVNPGWYWWACFPGCMPDGDAEGPFDTSSEARLDADEGAVAVVVYDGEGDEEGTETTLSAFIVANLEGMGAERLAMIADALTRFGWVSGDEGAGGLWTMRRL